VHPTVFAAFDRICRERGAGGRVLEVGALPDDDALLNLPALRGASAKIGINVTRGGRHRDFEVVVGSAHAMDGFPDASFDTVLCNATLEHDPEFWKTVAEVNRVTRGGGLIAIGVPGFGSPDLEHRARRLLHRIPVLRRRWRAVAAVSTLTFHLHDFPGDYYRFSRQAVATVLLRGLEDVRVESVLLPPRLIGSGFRPGGA